MTPLVREFRIRGLFGTKNVRIPIKDNVVVLVGSNGFGKTTIVNMLYAVLTKQWTRLLEYPFRSIAVDIGESTVSLERDEISEALFSKRQAIRLNRILPPSIAKRIERNPSILQALMSRNPTEHERVAAEMGLPARLVANLVRDLSIMTREGAAQGTLFEGNNRLNEAAASLDSLLDGQVVYLPTYRRIERDLQTLFPNMERPADEHPLARKPSDSHIEFVEFGMKDVERSFGVSLAALKETARAELNRLAATYLREVIAGEGENYNRELISRLGEEDIARIIGRIEEKTLLLPESEKLALRHVIKRIQAGEDYELSTQHKYVAHFFMKLMDVDATLSRQEQAIVDVVRVCNGYLEEKQLVFDETIYETKIALSTGSSIGFENLSSGEKQIVSLFTHIYLGSEKKLFMIIDEPELSLSVDWQKKLLPDIRKSGKCPLLVAVTHSPFIFDNDLDGYAVDLRACLTADA